MAFYGVGCGLGDDPTAGLDLQPIDYAEPVVDISNLPGGFNAPPGLSPGDLIDPQFDYSTITPDDITQYQNGNTSGFSALDLNAIAGIISTAARIGTSTTQVLRSAQSTITAARQITQPVYSVGSLLSSPAVPYIAGGIVLLLLLRKR